METSNIITMVLSLIGIAVTILLFAFSGIFKLGAFIKQIEQNAKNIKDHKADIKKDIEQNAKNIKDHKADIKKDIKENTKNIKQNTKDIKNLLKGFYLLKGKMEMVIDKKIAFESKSPIRFTDYGTKVVEGINAHKIINENWEIILKKIKEHSISPTSSLYDIQETCFIVGEDFMEVMNEETLKEIKKYAFKNGDKISWYGGILGLVIRDKYFKENNLKISEVEK